MIDKVPMIPIDDAFLGLCLKEAGLTTSIHNDRRFRSWGAPNKFSKTDLKSSITIHKYSPSEIRKAWAIIQK